MGYLTPSEFARRYYEKNQVTEVKQPVEIAGSLLLQVVLKMGAPHGAILEGVIVPSLASKIRSTMNLMVETPVS